MRVLEGINKKLKNVLIEIFRILEQSVVYKFSPNQILYTINIFLLTLTTQLIFRSLHTHFLLVYTELNQRADNLHTMLSSYTTEVNNPSP